MEVEYHAFVITKQNDRIPNGMDQHQQDGDLPAQSVQIKFDPSRHLQHNSGSSRIEYKSSPEENQMPPLQTTVNALAPNPNRIKD